MSAMPKNTPPIVASVAITRKVNVINAPHSKRDQPEM
jgi:hypothetical protein